MKKHIPSLNGLRAFSIILVIFSHAQLKNFGMKDSFGGQFGVNVFFVISGFLITMLLIDEENLKNNVSLKNFYIRRAYRIFPVYYFLLFIYFLLQLAGILQFTTASWVTSITYTKYFAIPGGHEWETGHFWSLSIEEHFYLIWPFVFKYMKSFRKKFAIIIVIIVPFVRFFNNLHNSIVFNEETIFQRADTLMWGCVFALYREQVYNFAKAAINKNKIVIVLPLLVAAFCIGIKFVIRGNNIWVNCAIKALAGSIGSVTTLSISCLMIVAIVAEKSLLFKVLNTGVLNKIGKLSYSLYIWQQLFFSDRVGVFHKFPFNLLCIAIVAVFSYNVIEKPFLKLKSKFEVIPTKQ